MLHFSAIQLATEQFFEIYSTQVITYLALCTVRCTDCVIECLLLAKDGLDTLSVLALV